MNIFFKNKNTITGIITFALSLYLIYEIKHFEIPNEEIRGIGPEYIPNVLAYFLCFLGCAAFIQGILSKKEDLQYTHLFTNQIVIPMLFFIGILSFIFFIEYIGFIIWSLLYLMICQYVLKEKRIVWNIGYAMLITGIIYCTFVIALNVQLPVGVFSI